MLVKKVKISNKDYYNKILYTKLKKADYALFHKLKLLNEAGVVGSGKGKKFFDKGKKIDKEVDKYFKERKKFKRISKKFIKNGDKLLERVRNIIYSINKTFPKNAGGTRKLYKISRRELLKKGGLIKVKRKKKTYIRKTKKYKKVVGDITTERIIQNLKETIPEVISIDLSEIKKKAVSSDELADFIVNQIKKSRIKNAKAYSIVMDIETDESRTSWGGFIGHIYGDLVLMRKHIKERIDKSLKSLGADAGKIVNEVLVRKVVKKKLL